MQKEPDAFGIGFFYEEEYIMNQIRKEEYCLKLPQDIPDCRTQES